MSRTCAARTTSSWTGSRKRTARTTCTGPAARASRRPGSSWTSDRCCTLIFVNFSKASRPATTHCCLSLLICSAQVNNSLQVFIDGPFGAPTSQIFHAQHAVLIGTGIGVTPFASILQSIMMRCCHTALQLGFTKLSLTDPGSPDLCQYNH